LPTFRYKQVTWNLEQSTYELILSQLKRYQDNGWYRGLGTQEYATELLLKGVEYMETNLSKLIAPSIILPGEKR